MAEKEVVARQLACNQQNCQHLQQDLQENVQENVERRMQMEQVRRLYIYYIPIYGWLTESSTDCLMYLIIDGLIDLIVDRVLHGAVYSLQN